MSKTITDLDNQYMIVELYKTGILIEVRRDQSILNALLEAGYLPDHSCMEGLCGACEVKIIEGEADHRDSILTAEEKSANKSIMICVSRVKSSKIVLDF